MVADSPEAADTSLVDTREKLRIVCGATIPSDEVHGLTLTPPLALIVADDAGIEVTVRWRWLRRLAAFFIDPTWTITWREIDRVGTRDYGMVVVPKDGPACRITSWHKGRIEDLVGVVTAHGVATKRA